ncbi:DUF262 domain-containing protein [Corallococcus exiguus]|uniref:DUF262 domain-containing protein n=1 Tax=Corallococcus TaxID=83461 RepID=UPI000F8901C9|nr:MULTISPECIES: DUF262 domain-containing protein [Corallococcus]NRD64162.1 DUF262 domain-containing protein [Corallococcus exiguus]RUO94159.1 DUF262 domain-containing protein [Corallococcus sp. AB018]
MEARLRSLLDLFDGKRRYLIPLFQRPYVWTEERQWAPLWEDIVRQASLAAGGAHEEPPHFIGAVVINQVRTFGNQVPAHEVIDGQQRLTTFQVLLAAIRDVAQVEGAADVASELSPYTANKGMMEHPDVERFKLWPTIKDQPAFTAVVSLGSQSAVEAQYPAVYKRKVLQPRERLVEAYLFFTRALRSYLDDAEEDRTTALHAVFEALRRRLQLVTIELSGNDDPQVIFETLNARGEPLLASDLLRNYVFLRAARNKEDVSGLHKQYWAPFDEEADDLQDAKSKRFWQVQERQGRSLRPRIDLFLQHFLAFKTEQEPNVTRLFHDYQRWIREKNPFPSVEAELVDVTRCANAFRRLLRPDPSTRLGALAVRLRDMDTSTVYPLMLALLMRQELPEVEFAGIATDIESFLIRRLVCGRTTKAYNRYFLQLTREVKALVSVDRAAFQSLLLAGEGTSVDWPDDAEFQRALQDRPLYMEFRASRLEMLLRALDEALRTAKTEKVTVDGDLSIEHVMPQQWEANWPLSKAAVAKAGGHEEAEQKRDVLVHTLGNLTLLTQELNASVSNGPYVDKQKHITANSALRMNTYFQTEAEWDEDGIRKRGEMLAMLATKLWPKPRIA